MGYSKNNGKAANVKFIQERCGVKWLIIISLVFLINFGFFNSVLAQSQADLDLLQAQIKEKETEIARLEAEAQKFRENLNQTQAQKKTLKNQLQIIEKQIRQLQSDLKLTRAKITKVELNIKSLSVQIDKKQKDIDLRKQEIAQSLRALAYLDSENLIITLFKNDRLSDFLSQSQYINNLQSTLYNDFRLLSEARRSLEGFKSDEEAKKAELVDLKKSLTVQNQLVQGQKKDKDQLLTETKNQEKNYQKQLFDIQRKQAEIQQEIFSLEDKLRGGVSGLPQARPGALAWPLAGRITQIYGPTNETGFYNDAYKFHNGIDIAAYLGAPIRAALDGEIIASGDDGRYAYGQWIALKHSNGLITLYAHLSAKSVTIGQHVDQGQVIGYEGASGFVAGPHLHFTVYATNTFKVVERWYGLLPLGGSVNPLDYL